MKNLLDEASLLDRIKASFPKLQWHTHEIIRDGWDYEIVVLDDVVVFRFPKKADSLKQFGVEMDFMDELPKLNLAIPHYIYKPIDRSFGGYKKIQGTALTPRRYKQLPPEIKKIVTKQIGQFLTKLHAVPLTSLEKFNLHELALVQNTRRTKTRLMKYIAPGLSVKQKKIIEKYFSILIEKQQAGCAQTLIHGDFSGDHLLLNDSATKLAGVIDFSDRSINDPAMDFARLWEFGSQFVADVYASYRGKKDEGFLDRSKLYSDASYLHVLYGAMTDHTDLKKAREMFEKKFVSAVEKL